MAHHGTSRTTRNARTIASAKAKPVVDRGILVMLDKERAAGGLRRELAEAAALDNAEELRSLLTRVDWPYSTRAIRIAAARGHVEAVKCLLTRSSVIGVSHAAREAAVRGQLRVLEVLPPWEDEHATVQAAIEGNHPVVVEWLLARGTDVDRDRHAQRWLSAALAHADDACSKALLAAGVAPPVNESVRRERLLHYGRVTRSDDAELARGTFWSFVSFAAREVPVQLSDVNEILGLWALFDFSTTDTPLWGRSAISATVRIHLSRLFDCRPAALRLVGDTSGHLRQETIAATEPPQQGLLGSQPTPNRKRECHAKCAVHAGRVAAVRDALGPWLEAAVNTRDARLGAVARLAGRRDLWEKAVSYSVARAKRYSRATGSGERSWLSRLPGMR